MKYETVIGLETHVELATKSKIFCACANDHTAGQNENVCPACCGMPGMLPVTNKRVVELGMTAGMLLNCRINRYTTFDKKSYYYPDLPCAYQITQWVSPIAVQGSVEIETSAGKRTIGIKQIHMEEDAGKLVHDDWTDSSLVDFNRTSVPLIEIVSKPDLRSVEEVVAYLEKLRSLLRFARVSECRFETGTMRCDVNLSIRPVGTEALGVRTEMKNMASISAISRAIAYEIARHTDALELGTETLVQETRRWDDTRGMSFAMRNKETAADYRYFPDPNLVPVVVDDAWFDRVAASLPEPAAEKKARYLKDYGLTEADAGQLTASRALCDAFEGALAVYSQPKELAAWLLGDCMSLLRKKQLTADELVIDPVKLGALVRLNAEGKVNRNAARRILAAVVEEDADPAAYAEANGLLSQGDESAVAAVIAQVLAEDAKSVADYRAGKLKARQALFGKTMKALKGNGDPAVIEKLLQAALDKLDG